ncbi:hypothetical protein BDV59DRAFT_185538 [Aspergillus ambiguus]|uniref:uncharacterized protein n=1 Tax=Aspergillus ambiguus TaxID=176160 RepID=UPI003CCD39DC
MQFCLTTPNEGGFWNRRNGSICIVNGKVKSTILTAASREYINPRVIPINKAQKSFSTYSKAPTVGCGFEPTLP